MPKEKEPTDRLDQLFTGYGIDKEMWRMKSDSPIMHGQLMEAIEQYAQERAAAINEATPQLLEACIAARRLYEIIEPVGGWQHVHDLLIQGIEATEPK